MSTATARPAPGTGQAGRPADRQTSGLARAWRRNGAGYMFLLPWLVGFFGLTLGPTLASLYLSFTNFDLLSAPRWIGLENYEYMFTADARFWQALKVTFTYVIWSVPLKLMVALGIAMLLDKGIRGAGLYRALFYLPSLIGASVAVAVLWRKLFDRDGIANQLLALLGYHGEPWLNHPDYALGTLVILAIWQFGSPMIIFLAGLRQIPTDLYEAASMDGARKVRQFFFITLPLLAPVIFFNLVLQMIGAFQTFTQAYIVSGGSGGPVDSTLFYTLYLYQKAFRDFDMGYASAMAWVLLLIIALFTWLAFATQDRWVHYGEE